MASIAGILDRIRGNRRQVELTAGESYYHLVRDVASGIEVDADDAAIVIETAGKTDSDFEADVATMTDRMLAAHRLENRHIAERELRKAEADLQAAQAKLEAAVNKLRPVVDEAAARRSLYEQEILYGTGLEAKLMQSVLDPKVLAREAELVKRFNEVQAKLGPLEADYRRHAEWLTAARHNCDHLRDQIRKSDQWNAPKQRGLSGKLEEAEDRVESETRWCKSLEALVRPLEQERAEINRQRAELQKQKLTP